MAAIWVSRMPGPEMAAVVSCLVVGQRLVGGQRAHPLHRLEADRTHHDEFAGDRLQQQRGLADDLAELGLDARGADQLLEVLQPVAALTAERDGVRLTGVQQVDERVRARARTLRRAAPCGRWSPCRVR